MLDGVGVWERPTLDYVSGEIVLTNPGASRVLTFPGTSNEGKRGKFTFC